MLIYPFCNALHSLKNFKAQKLIFDFKNKMDVLPVFFFPWHKNSEGRERSRDSRGSRFFSRRLCTLENPKLRSSHFKEFSTAFHILIINLEKFLTSARHLPEDLEKYQNGYLWFSNNSFFNLHLYRNSIVMVRGSLVMSNFLTTLSHSNLLPNKRSSYELIGI